MTDATPAASYTDPYGITAIDKDTIEFHIGRDVFQAFQGLTVVTAAEGDGGTGEGDMIAAIFRGALEAAEMEVEFSPSEAEYGIKHACTYATHPRTRALAAWRTGNAVRSMFGWNTRDADGQSRGR